MNPVSADELALIRSDAAAILDLPCVIQRATLTPDGVGSNALTWPTVSAPGLLCGMSSPSQAQMSIYADVIGSQIAYNINFPWNQDIRVQDRILVQGLSLNVQVGATSESYSALQTVLASLILGNEATS